MGKKHEKAEGSKRNECVTKGYKENKGARGIRREEI